MKKAIIILAIIAVVVWGGLTLLRVFAKSKSPEGGVEYVEGDLKLYIFYNRPSKKGRDIFSETGMHPYGKVWRTGADEATEITFAKDATFGGKPVKAGTYTLFTIPEAVFDEGLHLRARIGRAIQMRRMHAKKGAARILRVA